MSNLQQQPMGYDELKEFLVEKWGEQADSFPGPFYQFLAQWIEQVIDEYDEEFMIELNQATKILVNELATIKNVDNSSTEIKKMSFNEKDGKFVIAIANKHDLSTNGIHKLSVQDSKQTFNAINKKLEQLAKEGHDIKIFSSKKSGPVFAAFTNDNLDTFGFYKVLYRGNPIMKDFGNKNNKLF